MERIYAGRAGQVEEPFKYYDDKSTLIIKQEVIKVYLIFIYQPFYNII